MRRREIQYMFITKKDYEDKVNRNYDILLSIIDVTIVLGPRNIALRENWDKITHQEDGHFQFFINWRSNFDKVLKDHLETAHKSMTYLSSRIQNGLIQYCELEIRKKIVEKCKPSGYYSVMADETTDVSVTEHLLLCIRRVDSNIFEVREDFQGFLQNFRKLTLSTLLMQLLITQTNGDHHYRNCVDKDTTVPLL